MAWLIKCPACKLLRKCLATQYASTTREDFASTKLNAENDMKINSVLKHLHAHLNSANTGTLKYAETIMEREKSVWRKLFLQT